MNCLEYKLRGNERAYLLHFFRLVRAINKGKSVLLSALLHYYMYTGRLTKKLTTKRNTYCTQKLHYKKLHTQKITIKKRYAYQKITPKKILLKTKKFTMKMQNLLLKITKKVLYAKIYVLNNIKNYYEKNKIIF